MGTELDNYSVHEDNPLGYGSSLPVPSVQEIVRNDAHNVPETYIKNVEDRPLSSEKCSVSLDIPIIDLSLLTNGDEDELRKLDFACKDWGFFQVTLQIPLNNLFFFNSI